MRSKATQILIGSLLGLFLLAQLAMAQDANVDRMLDELEKRLERKEAGFITSSENQVFDGPVTELNLGIDRSTVTAALPGLNELQQISDRLVGIKSDIDNISGKVMKSSYDLMHSESAYKHARVSLKIDSKTLFQVDSLRVRLDGVEIYNIDRRDAFLLNSQNLPVYIGPLTKGEHAIDFDLSLRNDKKTLGTAVDAQEKIINQSLAFNVSDGENIVDFHLKQEGSGKLALQQSQSSKN